MLALEKLNPSMKALAVIVCIGGLAVWFDPVTPLLFLAFVVSITFAFSGVSWRTWLLYFAPFLLVAFSYMWTTALFPREALAEPSQIVIANRWFTVTEDALLTGLSLGLRVLCFASLSILFVATTDPTRFIFSLMEQCKLPPKIAYGILAGYRFLPLFKDEFAALQAAHRIRGVGRLRTPKERIKQFHRYAIPLLAQAIRKSERVAIAMESRGFTGGRNRRLYHKQSVTWRDWMFVSLMAAGLLVCILISWRLGSLTTYRGQI